MAQGPVSIKITQAICDLCSKDTKCFVLHRNASKERMRLGMDCYIKHLNDAIREENAKYAKPTPQS